MYNSASYRCKGRQCWPGVPSCLPITDRDPDDEPFLGRARSLDQPRGARTMASFAYVFDRRLAKTVIGAATQFLYDGPNIAQQVERQRTTSYLCSPTGRENDGLTGCTSIGRYYHPELRRFVSEDLIGFLPHALTVVDWMAPRELWSASPA